MVTTRRNFLRNLLVAGAAFTVLPSAATYARKWVRTGPDLVFRPQDYYGTWRFCSFEYFLIDQTPLYDGEILGMGFKFYQLNCPAPGLLMTPTPI